MECDQVIEPKSLHSASSITPALGRSGSISRGYVTVHVTVFDTAQWYNSYRLSAHAENNSYATSSLPPRSARNARIVDVGQKEHADGPEEARRGQACSEDNNR